MLSEAPSKHSATELPNIIGLDLPSTNIIRYDTLKLCSLDSHQRLGCMSTIELLFVEPHLVEHSEAGQNPLEPSHMSCHCSSAACAALPVCLCLL